MFTSEKKIRKNFSSLFNCFIVRFLDTSLVVVDVQPNYVRVTVKGKIFQMALNDEVRIDDSTSQRSQTTGRLKIVMPKLNAKTCLAVKKVEENPKQTSKSLSSLRQAVNIRNIVVDESEVPPLT